MRYSREKVKQLYEGKYFYEIVKPQSGRFAGTITLFGPFDDILYKSDGTGFVRVVDGVVVVTFKEEEILVTDRLL